jgi:SAM-dependent methyltransferase
VNAVLDAVHGGMVHTRRVARLGSLIADRIPRNATVLDVGTGDGQLAARIHWLRPDIAISGVDVLERPHTAVAVQLFDGTHLPFGNASFDAVTCVDVLHHAVDASQLLRECARVARQVVIIKDHLREGFLAAGTLRFMDWVGNARHGVRLPYNYLSRREWQGLIETGGADVQGWEERLGLYPPPFSWLFGRHLHVLMTLRPHPRAAMARRE